MINRIRMILWRKRRAKINSNHRSTLSEKAKNTSIISVNCTGGILSHDLGLKFLSPTVNLFMRAEDFIKFCENLEYYLNIDNFEVCTDACIVEDRTYPVANLGDLTLFLVHYNSVEEAELKWNERKQRINMNNIAIINNDREGMTDNLKERFEGLPYKKVMFTHIPDDKHPSCFYIKGYETESCVGIITDSVGWKGLRPIDQFDYVSWLND